MNGREEKGGSMGIPDPRSQIGSGNDQGYLTRKEYKKLKLQLLLQLPEKGQNGVTRSKDANQTF